MPAPTVPAISTLNFTVGQQRTHTIPIGNNPTWGHGFLQWDTFVIRLVGSNLQISGAPTRPGTYSGNFQVGNADGVGGATFQISVNEPVTPPPAASRPVIIVRTPTPAINAGVNYTETPIQIQIRNKPTFASITGLAIGMDWRFFDNGIEIIGTPPRITNLYPTRRSNRFINVTIFASNSAGSDSKTQPILLAGFG